MDVSENIVSVFSQSVDERRLIRLDQQPQRKGKKIQLSETQKQESQSNKLILDATETLSIKQKHIKKRNKIYENKKIRKPWSAQEDHQLQCSISLYGPNWVQIAASMVNRNPSYRINNYGFYYNVLRDGKESSQKIKPFTKEEDQLILKLVTKYRRNWSRIAKFLPEKTSKQIRERFINKLNPQIKFEPFTEEEDHIILNAYQEIGSKWTKIQDLLVGRPENMIKNRFYSYLRQKYLKIKNPYYAIPSNKALNDKDQQSKIDNVQQIKEEKQLTESLQSMENYNDTIKSLSKQETLLLTAVFKKFNLNCQLTHIFQFHALWCLGISFVINFNLSVDPQYQLYQAPVAVVYSQIRWLVLYSPMQQGQLNQQHGLNTLFQQQAYLGHQVTNSLMFLSSS